MGTCGKIVFFAFALWTFWFARLLYGMSPYFWLHGDIVRSVREWRFWFMFSIYAHDYTNNFIALRDYYIYPENFPDFSNDEPMEYYIVTHENVTMEILERTWLNGNGILHWKNATKGAHEKMMDINWIRENFDLTKYYEGIGDQEHYAYYNDSDWDTAYEYPMWAGDHISLEDFVDNTLEGEHLPYYLGFNFKICEENPKVRSAVLSLLDEIVEPIAGPDYYSSNSGKYVSESEGILHFVEFFFMYYGTQGYAAIHNAVMDDSFIQVRNTKRWVFTHPRYIPYMHMSFKNFGVAQFLDFEELPKQVVDVGPGEFLYFPPHYVHTVVNLEDTWGWGVGIRDFKKTLKTVVKNVFLGTSDIQGNVGAYYSQLFQILKAKFYSGFDLKAEAEKRSAVEAYQPTQLYDAWQIQEWHKHIADIQNQFDYLMPGSEQKRGVYYGNGRSHADSPFGPGFSGVKDTKKLQEEQDIRIKKNKNAGSAELKDLYGYEEGEKKDL